MRLTKILLVSILCMLAFTNQKLMAQAGTNTLPAGAKLAAGERLISANKIYYLGMQQDGNLCIKKVQGDEFVWCSMQLRGAGSYLVMQPDGNLVVYDNTNKYVWNTMTQAYFDPKFGTSEWKPIRAVIEDNGTLSLYNATNKKVWSNTDKPAEPIVSPGVGFTGPAVKKDLRIKLPGSGQAADITVEINDRGEAIYHGDMNLGHVEDLMKKSDAPTREEGSFKWPNSTIPYELPANHPRREIIQKGIDHLNKYTTICMVPRTSETDYVQFISRNGNWATLGRVGGMQEISIENNNIGTVIHEVMHALGFHHTQCREDRDNYVTINLSNVEKGKEHNFIKSGDKQSNLGVYDFTSCMHYPSYGFAKVKGVKTITRKDGVDMEMGQWNGMSQTDVSNIALVYPKCSGKGAIQPLPTTSETKTTSTGTATNPTTASAACEARDAVTKYQATMNLGQRLQEKEKMVSANGRYQFRATTDGNFVIEEVATDSNCAYKEVYRFPLQNGGSRPQVGFFSLNPDGNLCMDTKNGKTYCATTGRDATAALILNKAGKLELTNDGRLRLLDKQGKEIWTTPPPKTQPVQPTTGTNPVQPTTNPVQPTTNPVTAEAKSENEVFRKGKPILNKGEDFGIGKTLTSENNQYQARIVKQMIDIGSGRKVEQNRFVIEKITVSTVNGQPMITQKTEIWNQECKEGKILTNDKPRGQSREQQECFYATKFPSNAIFTRNAHQVRFGHIKLENDGSLHLIQNGHYKVQLSPVINPEGDYSKTPLHFRTSSELQANAVAPRNRLEIGQTLTSDNDQFQATITPERKFIIEQITVATRENGEQYIASRREIWNRDCPEGFIEIKANSLQPDCFKKELPVLDPTKPQRIPMGTPAFLWKLENDGRIKWYTTHDKSFVTLDPYL